MTSARGLRCGAPMRIGPSPPALAVLAFLAISPSPAGACPACESALAARRRVATEDLAWRLTAAVLPFSITVAAAVAIGRSVDRGRA